MKKKFLIGIGAVLGVALLAGAVFMGVRLLNSKSPNGGLGGLLAGVGGPNSGKVSFSIQVTPAPELPTAGADIVGTVSSIKDNSIFVSEMGKGTEGGGGNTVIVGKAITSSGGSSPDSGLSTNDVSPTPSGPVTEVVVSKETKIYRDTSMDNVPKPQPGSDTNLGIQQVLEPADVSSISSDSVVQVWGQKRGDRLIADTIVVIGTPVIMKSGAGQ
jgi:hypothetical protein